MLLHAVACLPLTVGRPPLLLLLAAIVVYPALLLPVNLAVLASIPFSALCPLASLSNTECQGP